MIEQSELIEQCRTHAERCRQLARLCPDEHLAAEIDRIAEDCLSSATKYERDSTFWQAFAIKG
jgi:uncharacterized Fe-S cluster protein YjdI